MKRILSALVLSALLLTMLAACGNQPDETTPVATTPVDTTPVETTPAQTEPPISMKLSGEYRSPEEAPLTDAEKKEILSFFSEAGKRNYPSEWWEKGDRIVFSSCEWRYYGRIGEAVVVAEPVEFWEEELALYVYQDGVSCAFSVAECPEEARLAVEEYHQSIMTRIQNGPPEAVTFGTANRSLPWKLPPQTSLSWRMSRQITARVTSAPTTVM